MLEHYGEKRKFELWNLIWKEFVVTYARCISALAFSSVHSVQYLKPKSQHRSAPHRVQAPDARDQRHPTHRIQMSSALPLVTFASLN